MKQKKWAHVTVSQLPAVKEYIQEQLKITVTTAQARHYMNIASTCNADLLKTIKNRTARDRITQLMEKEINCGGYDEWCFCKTYDLKYH